MSGRHLLARNEPHPRGVPTPWYDRRGGSKMQRTVRLALLSASAALPVALGNLAMAQPTVDEGPARAEAARRFADGLRAFDRGDYIGAAEGFDAAERLAPHIDTLWNAARAWARTDDQARAATLYARYLRESPVDAPDRGTAQRQLAALAPKLGRIEVHGSHVTHLTIDGRGSDETTVYVSPGAHVVSAVVDAQSSTQTVRLEAGQTVGVAFEPEAPPAAAAPDSALPVHTALAVPSLSAAEPEARAAGGLSPWVVASGGLLTATALGFTVWSGLETLDTLHAFDAHPTQANLSEGQTRQTRTNVLIGTTAGLALLTGSAAVFLVHWGGKSRQVALAVGCTSASVRWAF
jgi:hypothetical protein